MCTCLTEFDEKVYRKGLYEEGRSEEAIENAREFFKNGASYELIRKSIKNISDEKLKEIYYEVVAETKKK